MRLYIQFSGVFVAVAFFALACSTQKDPPRTKKGSADAAGTQTDSSTATGPGTSTDVEVDSASKSTKKPTSDQSTRTDSSDGTDTDSDASTDVAVGTGTDKGANLSNDPLLGSAAVVVTDLGASAPGKHVALGACAAPSTFTAALADCGGGTCKGNQAVCETLSPLATLTQDSNVVVDIKISPSGKHAMTAPACDSGYDLFMTVQDCGNAACKGKQSVCKKSMKRSALNQDSDVVTAVTFSLLGLHQKPGTCPTGSPIGTIADCGGGTCKGSQSLCVRKEKP